MKPRSSVTGEDASDSLVVGGGGASSLARPTYVPSKRACPHPFTNPVYLICVASSIHVMVREFLTVAAFSKEHIEELKNEHLLKPWAVFEMMGSVGVDFGDSQWRNFCGNFFSLLPFMVLLVALSRYVRSHERTKDIARFRHSRLAIYHCVAGLAYAVYLHGPRILFMLSLVLINFFIIAPLCKKLSFRVWLTCVWIFHIGILLVNDRYSGYSFSSFFSGGLTLDKFGEIMPWNVVFNMSTLRMIAYCIDYEEALHRGNGEMKARLEDKHKTTCTDCVSRRCACYKLRTDTPRPLCEYTLVHYLAYLFYVPLYVAGPMSSFNAFVSHIYVPQRWFGVKDGLRYFGRIAGYIFMLFGILHFEHLLIMRQIPNVSAVAASYGMDMRPAMFMHTLAFLWLKFSIIWKVFRLISLADGFDVPEDMQRCFAGATTIANFWRDWHTSFNIWIVRYMYIPLGGNKLKAFAIIPIFMFIAIWHDIQLQLLSWAFLICLVFVPETALISYFSLKKFDWLRDKPYYCLIRNFASSITISALILSNMVGYGTGESSAKDAKGMIDDISFDALALFVGIVLSICHVNWRSRDVAHEAERRQRWELGLPIDLSENIKSDQQLALLP